MNDFRDLDVYKLSKQGASLIHQISRAWPKEELYGLTNQIRRATISIISNISEGCGRATSKDTIHFLVMARGSCNEVIAQMDVACDLGYSDPDTFQNVLTHFERVRQMLNGLIKRYSAL